MQGPALAVSMGPAYLGIHLGNVGLEDAGFRDVAFHSLSLSPNASGDADYWAKMLNDPPAIMIEAIKV